MARDEYKNEYPAFFYVENSLPGIDPSGYDPLNRGLSSCKANVRIGPPLDGDGIISLAGIQLTCGLYLRKDCIRSRSVVRVISLDKAIEEMDKLFS
jgi:hypothetical protein